MTVPDASNSPAEQIAYVAIGSNLGNRREYLRLAVALLPNVVAVSDVYETAPVGGPADSGPYLNMVVRLRLRSSLDPFQLLDRCLEIERQAGRERRERWGPRTLDLDVLLYDDVLIETDRLTIPHPRMYARPFVLTPLADLAPELIPARCAHLIGAEGVVRVGELAS